MTKAPSYRFFSGLRAILIYSFLIFTLAACQRKGPVAKWPYGVNYEVFVRSFADSNGDGIGDLKGLTMKLDHLKDLGVGGVWLMPVMPSPSYHKYDVTDYRNIDPEYGSVEDFKTFVEEAHARGIRVLIDLVINHTGTAHPWFTDARSGKDAAHRQYYVWAKKDSIRKQIAKKAVTLDSDNITQWHAVDGDTTAEHYYGFFWGGMPDLNMDHPAVRREFIEIGRFWLDSMKVDGFRLDAARHIYPDERAADNHAFWIWFREEMQRIKPDVYLVGEVWSDAQTVAPYLKGLPALFNFDMGYAITRTVNTGLDTSGLMAGYQQILDFYNSQSTEFIDAVFLRNHDQHRVLSELAGDGVKMRTAASILMTLPGTPYIYYGEEIGMLGKKPDEQIREPFLWDVREKDGLRTRWEDPVHSTDATVTPLAVQRKDSSSLFNFYRNWITFRNNSQALTYGKLVASPLGTPGLIAFNRVDGTEELLVLHNLSVQPHTVDLPSGKSGLLFSTMRGTGISGRRLTIPAGGSAVVGN
ncbi:MAG: alpha-amylase family glycosyl hydrolase [Bacteroidota bacterium]